MTIRTLQTREMGDIIILELPDVLDYPSINKVRDLMNKHLEAAQARIILDFSAVAEINSTGIGIIISRVRRSREMGGDIKLINPNLEVRRILEVMGADRIFDIASTLDEGINLFQSKID